MDGFLAASPTIQMGLIVLGLLLIATLTVQGLKWAKPQADFSELWLRIRSWWIMVTFFFASLVIHPDGALLMFMLLSFLALKEYFSLMDGRREDHRALLWAYLAIPLQYWWVYQRWTAMAMIFIPVYMFLFIPFRLLLAGQTQGIIRAMSGIQWGLMAFVFCISHVALLLTLPETTAVPGGGRALVLYLVFLTEMNDIAQYTWGKLFGRRAIAPSISPKKTWEGFLGGLVTTVLLAIALRFLSGFDLTSAILTGLLIGWAGFIGDLVISGLKRDLGVKDASSLIPGHGGMLDRIDSLAYTAPLFFHYVSYVYYPAGG